MFKSKVSEGYSHPLEIDNDIYYFTGGISDTANDYYNSIALLQVTIDGDFLSKIDYSTDTSIGVSYSCYLDDYFLGLGRYRFNSDTIKGGMYNIQYNLDLNIYNKVTFPYPNTYTNISSSSTNILSKNDKFIKIVGLSEPYNNQGFEPGDITFYEYNLFGDTIRTKVIKKDKVQSVYDACYNSDSTQIWLFGYGFQEGVTQWVKFDLNFDIISIEEFDYRISNNFYIKRESYNTWIGCTRFNPFKNTQNDQLLVFRMDSLGNYLDEIVLGVPDTIDYPALSRSIDFSENGDIYISGTKNNTIGYYPNVPSWVMLTKLNSDFQIEFIKYYNNDSKYYNNTDIYVTTDHGIILSNSRYDSKGNDAPPYNIDCWIIKVDENGYMTGVEENESIIVKNALVFPNPGTNELKISCGWPNSVIKMYNLQGMEVINQQLQSVEPSINTSFLDNGKYIWNIYSNNKKIESGKWIKL